MQRKGGACRAMLQVWCICSALALLAACAHSPSQVPVEERSPEEVPARTRIPVHTVAAGETLWQIAQRYGVSVDELQQLNAGVEPAQLQPGDVLLIPAGANRARPSRPPEAGMFRWPLSRVVIVSGFGSRQGRHKGVDLAADKGSKIRASAAGVVEFAGRQKGYGRVVILQHKGDYRTLYAHNRSNKVKRGQQVKRGQVIALVGKSGNASGAHLHFELHRGGRVVDPKRYIAP
jgi:murein DD-endopeptidase MepM/ murein hydrolase activator NlpD